MRTTPTEKASAKKDQTKSQTIELRPFDVTIPWMEITVEIDAKLEQYLKSQTGHIQHGYPKDVFFMALTVEIHSGKFARPLPETLGILYARKRNGDTSCFAGSFDKLGVKMQPFTLRMEEREWRLVENAANYLGISSPTLIRSALHERAVELKDFKNNHLQSAHS